MEYLGNILRVFAKIRSSYRQDPVSPARDWVTLLTVSLVACAALLLVGASVFRSVGADVASAPARGSGVETIDRVLLQETIAAFRARTVETQKLFASPPAFADPSR